MVTKLYANYFKQALTGAFNWPTDTVGIALVGANYTFNPAHVTAADLTDVKTVDGVASINLANKQVIVDGVVTRLKADNIALSGVTVQEVKGMALFKKGADNASSPLLCYVDMGMLKGVTNGDFGITWSADGIITHTEG